MLRLLATVAIALLIVLDLALPSTPLGRRGNEDKIHSDVPAALGKIGDPFPSFRLQSASGETIDSSSLLGHRVLLIFERSVDW